MPKTKYVWVSRELPDVAVPDSAVRVNRLAPRTYPEIDTPISGVFEDGQTALCYWDGKRWHRNDGNKKAVQCRAWWPVEVEQII